MPGRNFTSSSYRYGFNGAEKDDEIKGDGNSYDFGARIYDSRLGRFLSVDSKTGDAPMLTPYHFCSNAPVSKIDIDGNWDIEVHAYGLRKIFGYAILVVKSNSGAEVYRTVVRVHGLKSKIGKDRSKTSGDTPTGVYKILNWQAPADNAAREKYGKNPRLRLEIQSGEAKGKRSGIALHGGHQENYDEKTDTWTDKKNTTLWNTEGCMRIKDAEIGEIKAITKQLEDNNPDEKAGVLTVTNDLFKMNGKFYSGSDARNLIITANQNQNMINSTVEQMGGSNPYGLKPAGVGAPPSDAALEAVDSFFKILQDAASNVNQAIEKFQSQGIEDKKY